jgi:uncharacterized protein
MHVEALYLYPLKGAAGIPVREWRIGPLGLEADRRWMLVGPDGGFLSQRRFPGMALLQPGIEGTLMRVEAPGRTPLHLPLHSEGGEAVEVEIWDDRVGAIAPDRGADLWFSDVLETPCRAVFLPDQARRPVDPAYAPGHLVSLADGFPVLLATTASLEELNRRLPPPLAPLPMTRFRPNLVVGGVALPHAEDRWRSLRSGDVEIRLVKPCARCAVTTVDPATGRFAGPEPLRTLAEYRRRDGKVFFGENGVVERGGTLRVGAPVGVEER